VVLPRKEAPALLLLLQLVLAPLPLQLLCELSKPLQGDRQHHRQQVMAVSSISTTCPSLLYTTGASCWSLLSVLQLRSLPPLPPVESITARGWGEQQLPPAAHHPHVQPLAGNVVHQALSCSNHIGCTSQSAHVLQCCPHQFLPHSRSCCTSEEWCCGHNVQHVCVCPTARINLQSTLKQFQQNKCAFNCLQLGLACYQMKTVMLMLLQPTCADSASAEHPEASR